MKKIAVFLLFLCTNAQAQAPDTLMVPMTGQERAIVLSMCQSAVWANRQAFDGICEFFKVKFETVAKAAEPKPEPTKPKE